MHIKSAVTGLWYFYLFTTPSISLQGEGEIGVGCLNVNIKQYFLTWWPAWFFCQLQGIFCSRGPPSLLWSVISSQCCLTNNCTVYSVLENGSVIVPTQQITVQFNWYIYLEGLINSINPVPGGYFTSTMANFRSISKTSYPIFHSLWLVNFLPSYHLFEPTLRIKVL